MWDHKLNYRPEIDGLRAIAVLSVICYHLKVDGLFPGGYLGVDVFFVISGFLISSIILKEISNTGSFSFVNFYKRRIRRLVPVLLTVLLVSAVAAWLILLPTELISFGKAGLASLFFVSNHYWYASSLEYEAQSSLLEPLLHTWTLSIEEQFYILLPAILVLSYKYFRKQLTIIFLIITLASFIFATVYTPLDESFGFYLLPSRFWELSAGGMIAFYIERQSKILPGNGFLKNLPTLSLVILISCFVLFDENAGHPGLLTLIPVLATMCVLLFANFEDFATKLLSHKMFVFVGLLSYSLYMWHFPIFAFARNIRFENNFLDFVLWIGLTFLLSFLSYKFIEQPFRNPSIVKSGKFKWTILTFFFLLIFSFGIIINSDGFPNRFSSLAEKYLGVEVDNQKLKNERNAFFEKVIAEPEFAEGKTNVLILGDSHSKDLYLSFYLNKQLFEDYSFSRIAYTEKAKGQNLMELNEKCDAAEIIIFCNRFSNKSWIFKELESLVSDLSKRNKRVFIALNTAEFETFGRDELFDSFVKKNDVAKLNLENIGKFFYKNRKSHIPLINDSIMNFAKKMNIEFLDRYSLVCNDESEMCNGITPEMKKVYTDGSHLSLAGAKFLGLEMFKRNVLTETSFVNNDFELSAGFKDFNMDQHKIDKAEEYDELYEAKDRFKNKLKNKNLTREERMKIKNQMRNELKAIREKLKK